MARRTLGRVEDRMLWASLLHLQVGPSPAVGLNHQIVRIELVVACLTEPYRIMATVTAPGVVQSLDRMDLPPVRYVALRHIVGSELRYIEVGVNSSTVMAVRAERLLMAVLA